MNNINIIDDKRTERQDKLIKDFLEMHKKINGIQAPTAFGKSRVYLRISKILGNTIVFAPTIKVTKRLFDENKIMQHQDFSDKKVGFIFCKSCESPFMCPKYLDFKKRHKETKMTAHTFCEREKKQKTCSYINNMTDDIEKSTYDLTQESKEEINRWLKEINSEKALIRELTLEKIQERIVKNRWCPYYFFKGMAKESDIIVCDYQYFIVGDYLKPLEIEPGKYNAIIDEFDEFEGRINNFMGTELFLRELEKQSAKLDMDNCFENKIFDMTICFTGWLVEKIKAIPREECLVIDMPKEMENDKRLRNCIGLYEELKNDFFDEIKIYRDKKRNELSKLLKFLGTRKYFYNTGDTTSYIEYIEKSDDVCFIRVPIGLSSFYKIKEDFYRTITIGSATLPGKEILRKDFNEEIKIFPVNWKIGKRECIILKSNLYNLSTRSENYKNFNEENITPIIDIIRECPKNSIVIFCKSETFLKNKKDIIEKTFNKNKIKLYNISCHPKNKQDEMLNDFFSYAQRKKAVALISSFSTYGRGVDIFQGNHCRLLITWGIPYAKYPKKIVKEALCKYYTKKGLDWNSYYYYKQPQNRYRQNMGRLIRSKNDYGYGILLSHINLGDILPNEVQRDLGVVMTTENLIEVIDSMDAFFEEIPDIDEDV